MDDPHHTVGVSHDNDRTPACVQNKRYVSAPIDLEVPADRVDLGTVRHLAAGCDDRNPSIRRVFVDLDGVEMLER
jgi:hypothetical protein